MKFSIFAASIIALASSVLASPSDVSSGDLEARAPSWGHHPHHRHSHGRKCHANSQCKTNVWGARPSCSAKGVCGFKCLNGYVAKGWQCVPPKKHHQCTKSSQCHISVQHATPLCWGYKCTFQCNKGYHREGDSCIRNQPKCDSTSCYPVQDGYSTCEGGKCSYHCATYLGYTLFTNSKKTAYRCINLESDASNCGEYGNVCKPGYNGKGWPYCSVGTCELDCSGYEYKYTLNGEPYCTNTASA